MSTTDKNEEKGIVLSFRKTNQLVRKLRIRDGDVLLLKSGTGLADEQNMKQFTAVLHEMKLDRVLLVLVDDFDDLKVLDKNMMAKGGWFRQEDLAALLDKIKSDNRFKEKPQEAPVQ